MVLKDAARLGIREKFKDLCFWYDDLVQLQKFAGDLAEGAIQLTGFKMLPSEWEIPDFVKIFKQSGLDLTYAMGYSAGIGWYDVYAEAIRQAGKKYGLEKVDGSAVYWAMTNRIKGFKPMMSNCSMTFSENKLYGPDTAAMYQIQSGKLVKIEDAVPVPDLLPGGKDVPK
jgi:hypothetical protein